jgi:hypothetical protein
MAVLDQATHQRLAAPPGMRWPADNPADWVEFVPRPESRRVIRAAIEAGVWDPEGAA